MCDKCLALALEALKEVEEIKRLLDLGVNAGFEGPQVSSRSSQVSESSSRVQPVSSSVQDMEAPRERLVEE